MATPNVQPWLDECLAAAEIERTGAVEETRVRPWGTVWRAATNHGPVWVKAPGPTTAFEVPLYALLQRVAPGQVLEPLAVDLERGWVLLPDGGPEIGDRVTGHALAHEMASAMSQYAELQRALTPHAHELLAAGVADMRPARMPERFDEAFEVVRGRAEPEAVERLAAVRAGYASSCQRLDSLPGEPSLDHNDLHPWNILVEELGVGSRARFYDWGDSVLAHPFACMLVPLGFVQSKLGCDLGDPGLLRVRDSYLDVFSDLAPHADLVEALELACHVAKVGRALVWHRALTAEGPADDGEFAGAPLETLTSILDDSYLGGA